MVWGRWEGGNAANPFVFALFEDDVELQRSDAQYGPQSSGPFSAAIVVGTRLDPAKRYEVGVSRGNGPESFDSRLEVIVRTPVLESVDYDHSRIVVVAQPPAGADHVLVASLWTGDCELTRVVGSATEVTISLDAPLEGWRQPYLRLHHQSESSIGRMGEAIGLIVDAPAVSWTEYDGQTVGLRWDNPPGGAVPTGGRVQLLARGAVVGNATASGREGTIPAAGLSPTDSHTVTVRATRGSVVGPVSLPALVITAVRSLASVTADGARVVGAFAGAPEAGVDRFVLELSSDAVTLDRVTVGPTGGVVPGQLDPTRSYTLAVRALGDGRSGPLGTPAGVVLVTPLAKSIASSATGNPTITVELATIDPVPWVTRWRASLLHDGSAIAQVEAAATTLVLANVGAIDPAGAYAVRLQALGDQGASLSGPVGAPIPVVVHAPEITEARWDGTGVHVSWRPLAQADLRGYTVTLHASDNSATATAVVTADTRATLAVASPSAGVVYTVTVVAHTSVAIGPAQASPTVVAMRPRPAAWFVSTPSQGPARVFRADPRTSPAPASGTVSSLLPRLFTATPAALPSVEGFAIRTNADARLPYALTVDLAATGIGSDDASARLAARAKFDRFLAALEGPALATGGVTLIRQVIARGLPLSFADTLFYAYGLDQQRRAIDLLAGMRLRVDASAYQLVPPDPAVTTTLSGYVARGSIHYELSSGGGADGQLSSRTAVDAFLARVIGVDVAPALSQEGAGQDTGLDGTVDLIQASLRRPWLRLVYPSSFAASNQKGSIGSEGLVALVAADTRAALDAASRAVADNGTFAGSLDATATFFRGRAALIPEIRVSLDGEAVHVPVGTTVRQLLERGHVVPLRPGPGQASADLAGITMTRSLGGLVEVADDLADGLAFDRREPVLLDRASVGTPSAVGLDRFDLPLLHGDALTTWGA